MIEYAKYGYGIYWASWTGSVLYSTAPKAMLAGVFAVLFKQMLHVDTEHYIVHPAAYFNSYSIILGFLIVFRTNMAHSRFWEGRTQVAQFHSKLGDVITMSATFVLSEELEARQWKSDMAQLCMLYEMLAMAHLRGVVDFSSPMLLGICTPRQLQMLRDTFEPHAMCNLWIFQMLVQRQRKHGPGGIDVSPPVMARVIHVLSEASLALANAKKVTDTPFPFPYAQLLTFFLGVFLVTCPLVIGTFIQSVIMTMIVSMLSVWAFYAINRVAIEIEDPFGTDSNDLPLARYVHEFQSRIFTLGIPLVTLEADDEPEQQVKVTRSFSGVRAPGTRRLSSPPVARGVRRLVTVKYEARDLQLSGPPEAAAGHLPTVHGSQLAVNEGMAPAQPPAGQTPRAADHTRTRFMPPRLDAAGLKASLASAHGNFSFALAKKYTPSSRLPAFERTATERALPVTHSHSAAAMSSHKSSGRSAAGSSGGKLIQSRGVAVLT